MEHLAELAGSFHRPRPLSITSTHSASSKRSDSPGRQSSVMKTTSRAGRSVEGTTFYRPRGSTTLPPKFVLGVAAMDQKARSKPMRNILNRLLSLGEFEIVIFGDKVLLDEEPETWPSCDFLISFFSAGFPMAKALRYVRLAAPFCVNDLAYQQLLWDRRVVLRILDHTGVRTPRRIVANRDLPTLPPDLVEDVRANGGPDLGPTTWPMTDVGVVDADTIRQGSVTLRKPFVEKPVSGEDHNVWIYYPESSGGGVRKLFRKVNNKSSEFVVGPVELRRDGSYVYEEFMTVDNLEDVKVYTIGDSYAHAETRKSPVVDGVVQRNAEGKEIRYITPLTDAERDMARKVCLGFRQAVCGFDLLRAGGNSYVIDVNGWSFVKGNDEYYDNCCHRLRLMFLQAAERRQIPPTAASSEPTLESAWRLKSFVSVLRHADRTPKQKLKFSLRSPPFMALLRGAEEEVVLKKQEELSDVVKAADEALKDGLEDKAHMEQLCMVMDKKGGMAGTKVQVKPVFNKKDRSLEKVQLVVKWGGEFTHAGLHQSKDLGLNLRKDLVLMNRKVLDDVKLYLSSERRVAATAEIFLNTFLNGQELPKEAMVVNRAMLDDSDAAKEQMELVKTKLQEILNAPTGSSKMNLLPPGFILPAEMVDPAVTLTEVIEMMGQLRAIMKENLKTMNMDTIQTKWCCQDTPFLVVERWEKLFENFCDVDRSAVEPSKISELYDSCKFDALHNREFLFGLFSNAEHGKELIRRLWYKAKDLFDFVAPQEYGVERSEKLEIGVLSALPLVKKLVQEIEDARDSVTPCTRLFFTKESKIITLLNVIIAAGFPVKLSYSPKEVDEVDYLTQIVFELYERVRTTNASSTVSSPGNSSPQEDGQPTSTPNQSPQLSQRATTPRPTTPSWPRDYSIRLSFSPGAHDNNVIDTQMDGRHSLSTAPRRWITNHINLDEALALFKSLVEKYDKRVRSTPEIADSVPAPVVGAPAV